MAQGRRRTARRLARFPAISEQPEARRGGVSREAPPPNPTPPPIVGTTPFARALTPRGSPCRRRADRWGGLSRGPWHRPAGSIPPRNPAGPRAPRRLAGGCNLCSLARRRRHGWRGICSRSSLCSVCLCGIQAPARKAQPPPRGGGPPRGGAVSLDHTATGIEQNRPELRT